MNDIIRIFGKIRPLSLSLAMAGMLSIGSCSANNDTPDSESGVDLVKLEQVTVPAGIPSVVKDYTGFTVNFNPENHTPNYVSWTLMDYETSGTVERSNKFWTDTAVEGCPDTRDYTNSGYDRGHMCPAAEQKWSQQAMQDCFVMTNMCPQKHDLNNGAWKTLEEKERSWAVRDEAVVIVAGPIYDEDSVETIGAKEVRVPAAFFKVILAPYAVPMRAIGFVYPNMLCPGNMENYSTTVDEVEKITGFDFFSSLPDAIENEIESAASFKEWNRNYKSNAAARR